MLNRMSDREGNTITLAYLNETGFAIPAEIAWSPTTFNDETYRYRAVFNYSNTRVGNDSYDGVVVGFPVLNRHRIDSISIKTDGVVTHTFRLGYDLEPGTSLTRLIAVLECFDAAESRCKPPMKFHY